MTTDHPKHILMNLVNRWLREADQYDKPLGLYESVSCEYEVRDQLARLSHEHANQLEEIINAMP